MKIKAKTGYKIVFWSFVAFTVACYIWTIISIIKFIIKLL